MFGSDLFHFDLFIMFWSVFERFAGLRSADGFVSFLFFFVEFVVEFHERLLQMESDVSFLCRKVPIYFGVLDLTNKSEDGFILEFGLHRVFFTLLTFHLLTLKRLNLR